ncbi:uncharacterized protein METZ01_LOCUS426445 [marine metagenome]|uniref:Uncharacterized protein n=1 Tax=marine metagenome TaxID=408172 RepID=A0A382XT05_9ZZZZ
MMCVDRYEATVFSQSNCSGTTFGTTTDDFPTGFPDLVESEDC